MVMFHRFLNGEHTHPADALRAAQLWMLNQDETRLPIVLAHAAENRDLSNIHLWAAFTYQGA